MYILPVWNVTPGMRRSKKSDSTTVFVEGIITPIFARKPTTSGIIDLQLIPCSGYFPSPTCGRGRKTRYDLVLVVRLSPSVKEKVDSSKNSRLWCRVAAEPGGF